MLPRSSAYARSNKTDRFNGEVVMLLAALFAVVWLRLALPTINFGQMMPHVMSRADAVSSISREIADSAVLANSQMATDQRCRDMMPGCDTYLQGLCPFAPVFVVTSCASHAAPVLTQAAPAPISADDLSPPGRALKIPPRP